MNKEDFDSRLLSLVSTMSARGLPRLSRVVNAMSPQRIAHILESSPPPQRFILWSLLSDEVEADVIPELKPEIRTRLLQKMSQTDLTNIISKLESDEIAEIIHDLPNHLSEEILANMTTFDRNRVNNSLVWPDDSIGEIMDTEIISAHPSDNAHILYQYIREKKMPQGIDMIPVVSSDNKYLGGLTLNDMVGMNLHETVRSRMDNQILAINGNADQIDLIKYFDSLRCLSVPVVDDNNSLVGLITSDKAQSSAIRERDEVLRNEFQIAEDTFQPTFEAIVQRFSWLSVNLLTAFIAVAVIDIFRDTLDRVVALAVLMPIVASMGGVAATQTLTLVVRGIALSQLNPSTYGWLFRREIIVASTNGMLLAGIVVLTTRYWFGDWEIGILLAVAMVINLLAGVISGITIPLLLRKLKIDAAISGSVVVTTITDIVGFGSFLLLATLSYL